MTTMAGTIQIHDAMAASRGDAASPGAVAVGNSVALQAVAFSLWQRVLSPRCISLRSRAPRRVAVLSYRRGPALDKPTTFLWHIMRRGAEFRAIVGDQVVIATLGRGTAIYIAASKTGPARSYALRRLPCLQGRTRANELAVAYSCVPSEL